MSKTINHQADTVLGTPKSSSRLDRRIHIIIEHFSRARALIGALIIVGVTVFTAPSAHASWHDYPENGAPGYVKLQSNPPNPEWHHLNAGDEIRWAILISLTDAPKGTLSFELQGIGELINSNDFTIEIQSCSSEVIFIAGVYHCDGLSSTIIPEATIATIENAAAGSPWQLGVITVGAARSLEIILRLGASADFTNQTGQLGLGITAVGDSDTTIATLPDTGYGSLFLPYLMGGLFGVGAILISANLILRKSHE